MKQKDIYIPKALCSHALSKKCVPQLRLYEYLKMSCSGKRIINKPFVQQACQDLNIHRSTFYRLLSWLKSKKWVTKSTESGLYFIISHERLLKKEGLKGNTAAYFIADWFDRFKAFLSGCVIGYLVKHQRKAERKNGRSNKPRPVATNAIAKILNIPESTAYHYKQQATQHHFIFKDRQFQHTGIHIKYLDSFRSVHPDIAFKTVGYNNEVCVCLPDLVEEGLLYKTKRY